MAWLDLEEEIKELFAEDQFETQLYANALHDITKIIERSPLAAGKHRKTQCAVCENVYELTVKNVRRSPKEMTCSDKCHLIRQQAKHASIVNTYTPRPDKRRMMHDKMRTSMVAFSIERTCNVCKRGNAMKSVGSDILQCKWCNAIR